jgi:hypothetical protein
VLGLKSSDLADGFWKSLTREAVRKIGDLKPQELSNTAYAVGLLDLKNRQIWLMDSGSR